MYVSILERRSTTCIQKSTLTFQSSGCKSVVLSPQQRLMYGKQKNQLSPIEYLCTAAKSKWDKSQQGDNSVLHKPNQGEVRISDHRPCTYSLSKRQSGIKGGGQFFPPERSLSQPQRCTSLCHHANHLILLHTKERSSHLQSDGNKFNWAQLSHALLYS